MIETWIWVTIGAAFVQNLRFMFQKQLKDVGFSTGGATFARFVYAAPLAVALLAVYLSWQETDIPQTNLRFWAFALGGALSQILATVFVVSLFSHRNFAVGITLKKTEVLLSALVGFVVLGEAMTFGGLSAVVLGFIGVMILSDPPKTDGSILRFLWNRAAIFGIASGLFFALSGVGYRGAALSLDLFGDENALLRAMMTLAMVSTAQMLGMALWLRVFEQGQITKVMTHWRRAAPVGLTSVIASLGWFWAFTQQTVAYVFALGQIELVFAFLTGLLVFREPTRAREVLGMIVLLASILLLVSVL
ncbi:EamA/RhaT family transporter [Algirhabdus cladophorae]|uniref:EamA family transporter n=1 Tax=Algirhabdus cladophorae TaxID=3377108 RepID=UPI003B84B638